jgi:hypothetical protein
MVLGHVLHVQSKLQRKIIMALLFDFKLTLLP